jgi:hypothetical protein
MACYRDSFTFTYFTIRALKWLMSRQNSVYILEIVLYMLKYNGNIEMQRTASQDGHLKMTKVFEKCLPFSYLYCTTCSTVKFPINDYTAYIYIKHRSIFSGLKIREYGQRDASRRPCGTLYPQKFALTSPTSGGPSVGIFRSRTQTTGFL